MRQQKANSADDQGHFCFSVPLLPSPSPHTPASLPEARAAFCLLFFLLFQKERLSFLMLGGIDQEIEILSVGALSKQGHDCKASDVAHPTGLPKSSPHSIPVPPTSK